MCRSRTTQAVLGSMCALLLSCLAWVPGGAQPGERGVAQPPQNNLVYEIFVRSFCTSDSTNHPAGNLKGIVNRLDPYLNDGNPETNQDLEVGILWLMPIFPSPSYHGYDVTDYRAIQPDYGTMEDFKDLLKEAHRRGVRVVLDIPFNHTSDQHPWFQKAVQEPDSPFRKYYHFQPDDGPAPGGWYSVTDGAGKKVRYFGLFSSKMPDLDFDNAAVRKEVKDIAAFWLDLGVDGFRLDAAKHIYGDRFDQLREAEILKNNDWWHEFSEFVYQRKPEAVLFGEVLGDFEMMRRHAWGLAGLVDEPFMNNLRAQVGGPKPGFLNGYKQFVTQARELHRKAPPPSGPSFQPFDYVASHDRNPRLASDLEEMKRHGMPHEVDPAYRMALYTLLTLSSRPILYQGDELMQRGWKWNGSPKDDPRSPGDGTGIFDETLREPFPWYKSRQGEGQTSWFASRFSLPNDGTSREEQDRDGGMLPLARALTHLRARHPVLANGDVGDVLSDSQDWMVFEKDAGREHYLVLINMTPNKLDYRFTSTWFPQYAGAQMIFWSDGSAKKWQDVTAENRKITDAASVPPFGLVVLRQTPRNR